MNAGVRLPRTLALQCSTPPRLRGFWLFAIGCRAQEQRLQFVTAFCRRGNGRGGALKDTTSNIALQRSAIRAARMASLYRSRPLNAALDSYLVGDFDR